MEKIEITKEDCLIRFHGGLTNFWYLHPMPDHPEITSEMYVVAEGRAGAKVFKDWDAKRFIDQAKHKEYLSIEYLIPDHE
jgi:hypothetical protein